MAAEEPIEIALAGELVEGVAELHEKLLEVPQGGECTLYINSPGGDPYCALSVMSVILLRRLRCTGIVTGECSSAALWPLAACQRRLVTRYSVFLFHPLRWESAENIQFAEATEWARHFARMAEQTDTLLSEYLAVPLGTLQEWTRLNRYVTGPELVEAGGAELLELPKLEELRRAPPTRSDRRRSRR